MLAGGNQAASVWGVNARPVPLITSPAQELRLHCNSSASLFPASACEGRRSEEDSRSAKATLAGKSDVCVTGEDARGFQIAEQEMLSCWR